MSHCYVHRAATEGVESPSKGYTMPAHSREPYSNSHRRSTVHIGDNTDSLSRTSPERSPNECYRSPVSTLQALAIMKRKIQEISSYYILHALSLLREMFPVNRDFRYYGLYSPLTIKDMT